MSKNINKTSYNKAQLQYLEKRITDAIDNVIMRWDNANCEPDDLTDSEKHEQIVNGTAKVLSLVVLESRFQGMRTDIEDAYEFIDPRKEQREECAKKREEYMLKVEAMRKEAIEMIYLGDQTALLSYIRTIEDLHP